jgi:hypothetical protein
MDVLVRSSAGELLIEVLAPTTVSSGAGWSVLYTGALVDALERVSSGLLARLADYAAPSRSHPITTSSWPSSASSRRSRRAARCDPLYESETAGSASNRPRRVRADTK